MLLVAGARGSVGREVVRFVRGDSAEHLAS
jgi:hypothetical protein